MIRLSTRERATALLSAMTAIAILGVVVTAQPPRTSPSDRLVRLESDLRYQLELGSRVDPAAFAQRTKSLDAALAAWRKSPQSAKDFEVMRGWLRAALVKSLPGEEGEWPEGPVFSKAAEVRVVRKEVVEEDERSQESGDRGQGDAVVAEEVKPVAVTPPVNSPGAAKPQAAEVVAAKPVATPRPAVTPPVVTKQNPQRAGNVDVAKRAAPTAAQAAGAYKGVKAELAGAKPPATADLRQAVDAHAVKVEAAKPAPVAVNLAELNARVGGYHEGLREIEAAVVAGREGMTVGQVAKLVSQLEQLAGHYQFVQLYYDSLTREERTSVTEPRSMAETVKLVERDRARAEAAADDDFLAASDAPVEEGELAMRLKALAEVAERGGTRCCD